MSSSHILGISVVDEAGNFGSRDSTTNLPSATAFGAAISFAAERASISVPDAPAMNERPEARSDFYELSPEPDTVCDTGGSRQQRTPGQLTFHYQVRGGGDFAAAGGGYDGSVLAALLASGMQDGTSPLLAADYSNAVTNAVGAANSFDGTGSFIITIGYVIAVDIDGRREYAIVTDVRAAAANDTIYHSPAFSRPLTSGDGDIVRICRTFSASAGNMGNSVAFQVNGDGWQANCYGCRWSSLTWTLQGRRLLFEFTFECALVQRENSSALVTDPTRLRGKPAHFLAADTVLSARVPEAFDTPAPSAPADYLLARDYQLSVDEFSCTITNQLTAAGRSLSIYAMSDWDLTDRTVELSLTLSTPETGVESDFLDQIRRMVVVGFGPGGAGNGLALVLPAGVLKVDPNVRDTSGDIVRQVLSYGAGRWPGDMFPGGGVASNTNLRIGLAH